MKIYLADAKKDLSSENDGLVMAMREREFRRMLYSFAYCRNMTFPIKPKHEDLPSQCPERKRVPGRTDGG